MKILFIHNKYGKYSGEEAVVDSQMELLSKNGHDVYSYFRSSGEIKHMKFGKLRAFFTAIYSFKSNKEINRLLLENRPDVVHIHNLFPLISPSVLKTIKKHGVPIVMTVHNYRLMCPNGLFYNQKQICEDCCVGSREWNCVKNNCEGSVFKSLGYALRNFVARKKRYYIDNVDYFACLTEFQKNKLVENGFVKGMIKIIPNAYAPNSHNKKRVSNENYVAIVGRVSPEKGIPVLLEAANLLKEIPFKIAGGIREGYEKQLNVPENVELLGNLNKTQLQSFYSNAKLLIHSSRVYEGFPMVFPEAMNYSLPIIAPNMAGYPEVVEENYNGLLFEPENSNSLADKVKELWYQNEKCQLLGKNGNDKMNLMYSTDTYFEKLVALYKELIK